MPKTIIKPSKKIYIIAAASAVGSEEKNGPLGRFFDLHDKNDTFGMKTWEASEAEMQRLALNCALSKAEIRDSDVDLLIAGDLINQCTSSSYGLINFDIPYIGIFGACSTAAEGLMLASLLCSDAVIRAASVSSSHNCSAERQFRFPVEYGAQRTPTAQWTVTGAGVFILSRNKSDCKAEKPVFVCETLPGCAMDFGISDANNMGAAMAPAAADTLCRYFEQSGESPDHFDKIITGDLGREGSSILLELMNSKKIDIGKNHCDCGVMIYDTDASDKHSGGSGCGCSAAVMASYVLKNLQCGVWRDVLFVGTGALMSPMIVQQGNNIPAIAHLVRLTAE